MKRFIIAALALFVLCLTGCTSEITLELKKDGAVAVSFNGVAGEAFAALINSATGSQGDSVIFDTKQIEAEMTGSGFEGVKAVTKTGRDLTITMTDKKHKSAMFSSGAVAVKDGKLEAHLDSKTLLSFYDQADSQTIMFLDMLLCPVFNDEKMTREEYLETIEAFYGKEIADEMKAADFKVTIINPDGSKIVRNIKLTKLLTLDETIRF